jgi:hypothetical protein
MVRPGAGRPPSQWPGTGDYSGPDASPCLCYRGRISATRLPPHFYPPQLEPAVVVQTHRLRIAAGAHLGAAPGPARSRRPAPLYSTPQPPLSAGKGGCSVTRATQVARLACTHPQLCRLDAWPAGTQGGRGWPATHAPQAMLWQALQRQPLVVGGPRVRPEACGSVCCRRVVVGRQGLVWRRGGAAPPQGRAARRQRPQGPRAGVARGGCDCV